ncbi:trypsin-1-like [Hetaerina americana]|uniref:trypsin-1-like n=1 Tax=Hetaerina americana TaxID=62018 RepID=UPI003A7F4BBE
MVSSEWAITTAHCAQVKKKSDLSLRVGKSADEVVSFPITTIVTHPNFDEHTLDFDYALLKDGEEKESMDFKYANVTIYSIKMCKTHHKGLTKRMICAGDSEHPENSCQGDTGGPLVSRGKLVGMVSWGQHCFDSNKPVVYAAINPIRKWIRKHMGI